MREQLGARKIVLIHRQPLLRRGALQLALLVLLLLVLLLVLLVLLVVVVVVLQVASIWGTG